MIELRIYQTEDGKQPFVKWHDSLKDMQTKLRIRKRLRQISIGNMGDAKSLGGGLYELRFFFGSGYRVYYAKHGDTVVLLLCGGDKSTQQKDISKAKACWKDYKERQ